MKYVALSLVALIALSVWLFSHETDPRAPRAPGASTGRGGAANAADKQGTTSGSQPRTDETGTVPTHVETSRWRITYLGPGGVPLADLPVTAINAPGGGHTDETGTITFDTPAASKDLRVFDPYTWIGRILTDRESTIRIEDLLPLEVDFRATDTGERIAVPHARLITRAGEVPLAENRLEFSPLRMGHSERTDLHFDLPEGYTSLSGATVRLWGGAPRTTRKVEATIALWPELELTVIARDADENPIEGATIKRAFLCAQFDAAMKNEVHVVAAPTDERGRTRVHGVPYLPGHPLTVFVDGGDLETFGFEEIEIAGRKASMTVDCIVDESDMPRGNSAIGLGGGPTPKIVESGTAALEIRYRDGTPASGARYRIGSGRSGKLDELGRLTVSGLKPGRYTVWLCESGRVPTRGEFEIEADETTRVSLREDEGWSLRVRTVDKEGKPLPYRPLRVRCAESSTYYALVVGGIQSIPIQTGADGSVVLPNLGREALELRVAIAGRTLAETNLPYDPARREIVLTLP